MSKIRVGCSPLSGIIYAGSVSKTGLWGKNKCDVTDEAINAVAASLLHTDEVLRFKRDGDWYELKVEKKTHGGHH